MNQQQLAASNEVQWQRNNDAYLGAALQSLRTRLHRLASAPEPPAIEPESKPARTWFFQRREEERPRLALPVGDPSDAEIKRAAAQTAAAEDVEPPPALHILASRFGLSQFERDVLLLCAGMELDTRIAGLCAHAQQDPSRPYPTFALALALFDEPAWDVALARAAAALLAPDRDQSARRAGR